jgi:SNF2 family DNA or RNA helicase
MITKTTPLIHQKATLDRMYGDEYHGFIFERGCGKTWVTLVEAANLFKDGKIDHFLVVAPKGVFRNWTLVEMPEHWPEDVPAIFYNWSSYPSTYNLRQQREFFELKDGDILKVLAVNSEALAASDKAFDAVKRFVTRGRTYWAWDESTDIKSTKSQTYKIARKLGPFAAYRRILTGSLVSQSILDAYSQTEFLKREALGFKTFVGFRSEYAIVTQQTFGARSFPKIEGYKNHADLKQRLQRFCTIVRKKDCLDLPDKIRQVFDASLSPKQITAYNSMAKLSVVEIEQAIANPQKARISEEEVEGMSEFERDAYLSTPQPKIVVAELALTKLMKLHQITCGYVKDEDKVTHWFDDKTPRVEELVKMVEGMKKVIIWSHQVPSIERIIQRLTETYGRETLVHFYGATSDLDRDAAKSLFQDPNSVVRFFVSNPASGGMGNTLTAAADMIYFSNGYSVLLREQSEDRAHRIGQTKNLVITDMMALGTVDKKVRDALVKGQNIADAMMESNWRDWFKPLD